MNLKPCPFCGSSDIYVTHTRYYENEDTVCIFCNTCKQCVILEWNEAEGISDTTRAKAVEAWNTRVEHTCQMTLVEPPKLLAGWHRCSECGDVYPPCNLEIAKWALQYCPRCGAKVVE